MSKKEKLKSRFKAERSLASFLNSSNEKNEKISTEKEEAIAKSLYNHALSYQSFGYYDKALDNYKQLMERELVRNALVESNNMFIDTLNPTGGIDYVGQNSSQKLFSNLFLYLKYLSLKNMGKIYQLQKNYDFSSICYSKALLIDNTDSTVWFEYSVSCFEKGDYNMARFSLEKTLSVNPNHPLAILLLMELLYIIGDVEESSKVAKQVLDKNENNELANFIFSEANPNPFNLLYFNQNKNLPLNSNLKLLDQKAESFVPDQNNETFKKKIKLLITEVDWKSVCLKLLSSHQTLLQHNTFDCDVYVSFVDEGNEVTQQQVSDIVQKNEDNNKQNGEDTDTDVEIVDEVPKAIGKRVRRTAKPTTQGIKRRKYVYFSSADVLIELGGIDTSIFQQDIEVEDNSISKYQCKEENLPPLGDLGQLRQLLTILDKKTIKLMELFKIFVHVLCEDYWKFKWPDKLSDIVCHMISILTKFNIEVSFACRLFLAEVVFSKFEIDKDKTHYLIFARKNLNKLNQYIVCGKRDEIKLSKPLIIRFLWIKGCIDQRNGNSISAKKWIEEGLGIIEESIILPNCYANNLITLETLSEKLNELTLNKTIEVMGKLVSQSQYIQALYYMEKDFLKHVPKGMELALRDLLFNILRNCDDFESVDTEKFILIIDFIFSGLTEQTIEHKTTLKSLKLIIPKIFKYTSHIPSLNQLPQSMKIAAKLTIIYNRLVSKKSSDIDDSELMARIFILFYRFAVIKGDLFKKRFFAFCLDKFLESSKKRYKFFFKFLINELYNLYNSLYSQGESKDKMLYYSVHDLLATVFYLYYNVKISATFTFDETKIKSHFEDAPQDIESSKEACSIIFKITSPNWGTNIRASALVRKDEQKILTLVYNAFRDLPNEALLMKQEILRLIDELDPFSNPNIDFPSSVITGEYRDVYENAYYYLGEYIHSNIKYETLEAVPPPILKDKTSVEYTQSIYMLEKALCCKPNSFACWLSLAEKYEKLLMCLRDLIDVIYYVENVPKDKQAREHLRLGETPDYISDLKIISYRALRTFYIASKLTDEPIELSKIYYKIGSILYGEIDLRTKYLDEDQIFSEQMSVVGNTCFDYLEKGSKLAPTDFKFPFLMARVRHKLQAGPEEYLPLYKKSLQLSKESEMIACYFNLARYYILQRTCAEKSLPNERKEIEDYIIKNDVEIPQKVSQKKGGQDPYFIKCPTNIDECPIKNPKANVEVWKSVLNTFTVILKRSPYSHKALYGYALCVSAKESPWVNSEIAEKVLTAIFKKKTTHKKPDSLDIRLWIDESEILKLHQRSYRRWKEKCFRLYMLLLFKNQNIEDYLALCTWFRSSEDHTLLDCHNDCIRKLYKLFILENTSKHEHYVKYLIQAYVYVSDKNWTLLYEDDEIANSTQKIRKKFFRLLLNVEEISKLLPQPTKASSEQNVFACAEYFEKKYGIELIKLPKRRKKTKETLESKKEEKKEEKENGEEGNEKKEKKTKKETKTLKFINVQHQSTNVAPISTTPIEESKKKISKSQTETNSKPIQFHLYSGPPPVKSKTKTTSSTPQQETEVQQPQQPTNFVFGGVDPSNAQTITTQLSPRPIFKVPLSRSEEVISISSDEEK
ncbi:hypothetical protein ABK040_005075 [Willaertia magna]